ncbi:glycosyltransferase family 2 protein [Deinococcus sp. UYEF24]
MNDGITLCAVVVSYNPGPNILELSRQLMGQNCRVVIVDNGSADLASSVISQCEDLGITVLRLHKNLGIGYALNIGCRFWVDRHYEWILTFDQDSIIGSNFLLGMDHAIVRGRTNPSIALFGPVVIDSATKMLLQSSGVAKFVITSGSCINGAALKSVGFFNEDLFIDYVDFDICIRLRQKNFSILVVKNVEIIHSIGSMKRFRILYTRFGFVTTNHAAVRRYYKHRNFIFMLRNYITVEPLWLIKQSFSLMIEPLKILIAEEKKLEKISMIVKGLKDGFSNIYGAYSVK